MKLLVLKATIATAALVGIGTGVGLATQTGAPAGAGEHAALLMPLAKAYASDWQLAIARIDTAVAAHIDASNRVQWAQALRKALRIGYSPDPKTFRALPLEALAEGANVRMARGRLPSQVVEERVIPGQTIVEVTWRFEGAEPVKSFTILNARGRPVFDTLISMPVVLGPVLKMGHF